MSNSPMFPRHPTSRLYPQGFGTFCPVPMGPCTPLAPKQDTQLLLTPWALSMLLCPWQGGVFPVHMEVEQEPHTWPQVRVSPISEYPHTEGKVGCVAHPIIIVQGELPLKGCRIEQEGTCWDISPCPLTALWTHKAGAGRDGGVHS